jgi:hypothetical protein
VSILYARVYKIHVVEDKMAKFLLVYYGGQVEANADPKMVEQTMAVWMKWFADLGKAVVDMGAPTQLGKLVTKSGVKSVGAKPVAGYTILQANSLDAAIAWQKAIPM